MILAVLLALASDVSTIRGKLIQRPPEPPVLELANKSRVALTGDKDTAGVLNDKRLAGVDLELRGRYASPDKFAVDPIHTKAMHVHKSGKSLLISYWCDVCAIRTYTPGICWCCQQDTELDLKETIE